eukprot:Filipodium_phascolosomae@DN4544_c0_g1_i1.p2
MKTAFSHAPTPKLLLADSDITTRGDTGISTTILSVSHQSFNSARPCDTKAIHQEVIMAQRVEALCVAEMATLVNVDYDWFQENPNSSSQKKLYNGHRYTHGSDDSDTDQDGQGSRSSSRSGGSGGKSTKGTKGLTKSSSAK